MSHKAGFAARIPTAAGIIRSLRIEPSRCGKPTARVTCSDGSQRFLHSAFDPEREAHDWAAAQSFGPRDILVVFGVGLGYHLVALRRRLHPQNLLLAVEPLTLWGSTVTTCEVRREAEQATSGIYASWQEAARYIAAVPDGYWRTVRVLAPPIFTQLFPEAWRAVLEGVRQHVNNSQLLRQAVRVWGRTWQTNLLENLLRLPASAPASRYFGALRRKPAVLVGAGPSLEGNVDLLEEAAQHCWIVATGTAARLLARRGLPYDCVVSVDPGEFNYKAFFESTSHDQALLFYDICVHPGIPRDHGGPKVAMAIYPDAGWIDRFVNEPLGRVETGGSVSNVAFDLLCRMDAEPIILIGQDLAYPTTQSHAAGVLDERYSSEVPDEWIRGDFEALAERAKTNFRARKFLEGGRIVVPAVGGGEILTDRKLFAYLSWFEEKIARLGGRRTVIDATEGGALIRGTRVLRLAEALRECRNHNAREFRAELPRRAREPLRIDGPALDYYLRRVGRNLLDAEKALQALLSVSADAEWVSPDGYVPVLETLEPLREPLAFVMTAVFITISELLEQPRPPQEQGGLPAAFFEQLLEVLKGAGRDLETARLSLARELAQPERM
ncbi:MAG TPA: DUF115 domain-containing protein [Acidobacteriota bacterium]|nr:DUF115 domain-containing protein [Acidobacteriota bacterium]HRR26278.1 DUF115 domain-containing protein [Acidobacteriota bacterium]HRV07347.1 DUF115 domain-containing protein [Acidobacteriota bacterium]